MRRYICNKDIYTAEGRKLEDTIFSVIGDNFKLNHYVHQDIYYNSMKVAETLLDKKTRVCYAVQANTRLPFDFIT
jgi:hypothetical protein